MMSSEPTSYTEQWRDLKRRTRVSFGVWLGIIPFGFVVMLANTKMGLSDKYVPYILGSYGIGWAVLAIWQSSFLCPRCGEWFFRRANYSYHNPFSRKCLNCGLQKYAEATDQDANPKPH